MATPPPSLSQDEIAFTNAFNTQRTTLAFFATCKSKSELHVVRDGFYLGLASTLCPTAYEPVRMAIVMDASVASAACSTDVFQKTVESARTSPGWDGLVNAVKQKAEAVGTNLEDGVWMGLETGRLEWLAATSGAHGIKMTLKKALDNQCGGGATEGDVSDAKMVWIYSLCLSLPALRDAAEVWRRAVKMKDETRPLVGYNAELWDCRKKEWAVLDLGAQRAAELGGSSIDEAWRL